MISLIDLYTAQRDYQVAEALEETGADDDRKLAWADARLSRATSRADADLTWKQMAAPVISAYVINDATAMKGVATQLAANEVAYDLGVTAATVALRNQDSSALADFQTDSSVVQGDFMMAKAGARTDWWLAEYEASVVALAGFSVAMGTPWAQYKAEQAVARRDWWLAQEPLYLAWMDQTAGDDTAFESDCGDALVDRSAARGTADGAIYGTMATAESAQVVSGAEADRVYASTLAGAYPTYQQAVATADRAYDVAVAVAERALELGGSQGDYDAALATARAARAAAQRSAAERFLAAADLAYAQAVGAARVDFVDAYGAAELTYVTEVADARVTRVTNVATADAAYFVQESASLEAALAARALTHPSPWATHHVAQKAARADATAIVAPARAAHDIALAEATRELEIAQIEMRIALDVALTDAEVADWVASTAAAVDCVVDERDSYVALASLVGARGVRQARAAAGENQPDDTPPDLDPGLAADETWDPADMEDYDTASDDAADPTSIHFCSMTEEDVDLKLEVPDGTNYIARTWWYSAADKGLWFNDRYFGESGNEKSYISHSKCYFMPFEFPGNTEKEKAKAAAGAIQNGLMYFELTDGEWSGGKALEIERERDRPLPSTNSVGTPELRDHYNRIQGEIGELGQDFALHSLEMAMYVVPGPEDLAFAVFWKYAGERGFGYVVVQGKRFLCKVTEEGAQLLKGTDVDAACKSLKQGFNARRVAPDLAPQGGVGAIGPRRPHIAGHGHTLREINMIGGSRNCASCALATDATLAGRASSAINLSHAQSVRWDEFTAIAGRQWHGANSAANKLGDLLTIDEIKKLVPNHLDRGIVGGLRAGREGHFFNVVNQNGVIRFLDGQTGTAVNLSDGFIGFLFMFTR